MLRFFAAIFFGCAVANAPVQAATTVFDAALGASTSSAPAGPLASLGVGDTLRINFSTPFAASGDAVVQVALGTPGIQFSVGAGQTVAGTSTTTFQQTGLDSSGGAINFFSLAFQGCGGGCDFIDITATGINFGSGPLVVNSIGFGSGFQAPGNGNPGTFVSSLTSPISSAPEPSTWLMVLVAFFLTALRLKSIRKSTTRWAIERPFYMPPLGAPMTELAPVVASASRS